MSKLGTLDQGVICVESPPSLPASHELFICWPAGIADGKKQSPPFQLDEKVSHPVGRLKALVAHSNLTI